MSGESKGAGMREEQYLDLEVVPTEGSVARWYWDRGLPPLGGKERAEMLEEWARLHTASGKNYKASPVTHWANGRSVEDVLEECRREGLL